jgi:hypothetical protein
VGCALVGWPAYPRQYRSQINRRSMPRLLRNLKFVDHQFGFVHDSLGIIKHLLAYGESLSILKNQEATDRYKTLNPICLNISHYFNVTHFIHSFVV